eukprot:GEZU01032528.1.p1 GENE.GEZU01032528.1~~GEZU01032528.1.p1  ORF type:complete len:429 (-),score=167.69 GEZU01032528.1:115-1401(-)
MKYIEAAEQVLRECDNKKGLTASEIVDLAIKKGYLTSEGKTPKNSMSACLTQHIKKHGDNAVFSRTAPGLFALRDPNAPVSITPRKRKSEGTSKSPRTPKQPRKPRTDGDEEDYSEEEEEVEQVEGEGVVVPPKKRAGKKKGPGAPGAGEEGADAEGKPKKKKKISRDIENLMIKKALAKQGYTEQDPGTDKDCLYYAFYDQLRLLGLDIEAQDPIKYLRDIAKAAVQEDKEYYRMQLKSEQRDFDQMYDRMMREEYGDKLDIVVLSRLFKKPVLVFKIEIDRVQLKPLKIPIEWSRSGAELDEADEKQEPIRFAYHMFHGVPYYTSVHKKVDVAPKVEISAGSAEGVAPNNNNNNVQQYSNPNNDSMNSSFQQDDSGVSDMNTSQIMNTSQLMDTSQMMATPTPMMMMDDSNEQHFAASTTEQAEQQ